MKLSKFVLIALTGIVGTLHLHAADATANKPNIVFILADDLGINGISSFGADIYQTPNIDSLAKSGMRFEHCYAAPLCGPSRAMLMTGRYAFHTGMTGNDSGPVLQPKNEIMMPRVLKAAGYVTAMCGKWSQLPLQPGDWGFDEYLRFNGSGKYWNSQDKNDAYMVNGKSVPLLDGEYLPDKMHAFVTNFITSHQDQPFYLYFAMSHVHADILHTPDSATNSADLFTDNVNYMDKLVGKLLAELDRLKLRDNTLIFFVGDNGLVAGQTERSTVHGKVISGYKGSMLEGGSLVPMIANWPGKISAGKVTSALIDLSDFFPTLTEAAGAKLPAGVAIDGRSILPQLQGKENQPRDWIFVELGRHWYVRNAHWKLDEAGQLFDLSGAPFAEPLVLANTKDASAIAMRKHLQAVLDQLNPAGGKVDPGDGSGRHANRAAKAEKKAAEAKGKPAVDPEKKAARKAAKEAAAERSATNNAAAAKE